MNLTEILQHHARQYPQEIAIVDRIKCGRRQTSYAELDRVVGQVALMLRQSGLRAGDPVLLFHPMSLELYMALAALLRNGMTAMFVDPSAGREYLNRCCELLPPQGLIASSKAHWLRLISPAVRRIPNKWSIGGRVPFAEPLEKAAHLEGDHTICSCRSETPALASFTSGSTGEPKAAIRTHGFLLAQHRAIEASLMLRPKEIELVTLPIFVLANLASRVTSVIADADLRRPADIVAEPVVNQIQEQQADRTAASPAFLERLVDCCERKSMVLPSLRKIFTGGGPVPPRLLDQLQGVAPHAEITVVYGSTEAEPISTLPTRGLDREDAAAMSSGKGLLVGRPVDSLEVRVMQDRWGETVGPLSSTAFARLCRTPGEAGEIVVSGDHVLDGYLHGQGENENKFQVGQSRWHRTGDAGYFDDRGRLWLLGRCAARVDDGRGVLYPLGAEQAAMRHPCIGGAAMVSHRGQRVLVVTLRDPHRQPDLPSLLKSLAFANVDSVRIMKRLPLDGRHNAKIDYPQLHRLLES